MDRVVWSAMGRFAVTDFEQLFPTHSARKSAWLMFECRRLDVDDHVAGDVPQRIVCHLTGDMAEVHVSALELLVLTPQLLVLFFQLGISLLPLVR